MKKKKNNKHKIPEKKPPVNQNLKLPPKSHSQLTVVSHQGYNLVSTNLSNNFFEGLLIKEMELNNAFTMDKLLELVNQYSLAIEYYLQIDPIKAKAYQIRMEYLLTNKDTLVQLSRHTHGKVDENEKNQKNKAVKTGKDFNKTKQYVKLKQEDLKYEDFSKQVNTVLNKGNKKDDEKKNVQTLINDDIKKQDESWKEKFKNKKKNSLNKSVIGGNLSMSKKFSFDKSLDLSKGGSLKLFPKNNEHNKLKNEIINDNKDEEIKEVNEEISKNNIIEEKKDKNDGNNIIEEKKDINDGNNIIVEKKDKNDGNNIIEENKEDNKDKIEEVNIIQEEKIEENENKEEEIKKEKEENKEEIKDENKKIENNEVVEKQEEDGNQEDNLESIINKIMREQEEEEEEDDNKKEENKEEKKENQIENQKKEDKKEEEDLIFNKIIENPEPKELPPVMARTSIVDEDMIKKMEPDEEISKAIKEQIESLKDIISNLNKRKSQKDNENDNDNEEDEDEESNKNSEHSNSNSNLNKISLKNEKNEDGSELIDKNIDKIPAKFRSTYYQVESLMIDYMNNFHEYFYQDVFEQFSSGLRELYELKYKKYIEIRNEYHNQIKENEYLLENDENLKEEKKLEIQQTIESLNEEQQHQIDTIEDEFNRKIMDKISEFRLNSSKSNSGIQLLEERIKLDIYSLINESFY